MHDNLCPFFIKGFHLQGVPLCLSASLLRQSYVYQTSSKTSKNLSLSYIGEVMSNFALGTFLHLPITCRHVVICHSRSNFMLSNRRVCKAVLITFLVHEGNKSFFFLTVPLISFSIYQNIIWYVGGCGKLLTTTVKILS